jgi:hypothetical protein
MKKSAEHYLDRLFSNEASVVAEYAAQARAEMERLIKQLREAARRRDFKRVRLMLKKIRAEVDYQEPWFVRGVRQSNRSRMEQDVEFTHLYLCDELDGLPTPPEIYRKVQELARGRHTSYTEAGVRKIIKRLKLPVSQGKSGPRNP